MEKGAALLEGRHAACGRKFSSIPESETIVTIQAPTLPAVWDLPYVPGGQHGYFEMLGIHPGAEVRRYHTPD